MLKNYRKKLRICVFRIDKLMKNSLFNTFIVGILQGNSFDIFCGDGSWQNQTNIKLNRLDCL